jgi:ribosomal subunit interface protein
MRQTQITIRDMSSSPALKSQIEERANKLERFYDRINSCRVVIDLPQKHKHNGKLYNVKIDLKVPGKELVVNRQSNKDAYVAIRNAFDALERQLEDHARIRKGCIKTHEPNNKGIVKRVFKEEGYGFLEGHDGNVYYFSDLNMANTTFAQLAIGDTVEFIPQTMTNGLHAHHIIKT